ncbi:MAG: glycosyltransferase, partial [Colwellia sp.]|nr:glycosyltransferase [Colwellia sp.]
MSKSKVCVGIPVYNYGRFVDDAINSVLSQDDETTVLLVDDCSQDDSRERILKYKNNERCEVIFNEANLGAVKNFNNVFQLSDSDYYLQLGADDFLMPGALNKLIQVLDDNPEIGFVYGKYVIADNNSEIVEMVKHQGNYPGSYIGGRNELPDLLVYDLYINVGTTLYRREVLEEFGFFDETLKINDTEQFFRATDYDLSLRMSAEGVKSAFIDQYISAFRIHGDQASVGDDFIKDGIQLQEHLVLLERYITEQYFPLFSGYENEISRYFQRKIDTLRVFEQEFNQLYPRLKTRIETVKTNLLNYSQRTRNEPLAPFSQPTPLVSVIIPTKDREAFLVQALNSLHNQSYENWEAIIINDGGEDISAIIDSFSEKDKLRYFDSRKNQGQSKARNIGMSIANGEIICFLDDDDVFLEEHLATVVNGLQDRDFVYTLSECIAIDPSGDRLNKGVAYGEVEFSHERLLISNFIPINTWAVRKKYLRKVGDFKETMSCLEDWELLIRISKQTEIKKIGKVTVNVNIREHLNGVSVQHKNAYPEVFRQIYAEHEALGFEGVVKERDYLLTTLDEDASENDISSTYSQTLANQYDIPQDIARLVYLVIELSKRAKNSFVAIVSQIYQNIFEPNRSAFIATVIELLIEDKKGKLVPISKKVSVLAQLAQFTLTFDNRSDELLRQMRAKIAEEKEELTYSKWQQNHALQEIDAELHAERMSVWKEQPLFHLVMFMYEGEESLLANTIESLSQQFYGNWKLSVIADGPTPDPIFNEVDVLEWVDFSEGEDPYVFVNQYMINNSADWLLFIPAGIQFEPQVFLQFGDYIDLFPTQNLFYCDDDLIDADGKRSSPRFKPDFNLDLLRSSDYIGVVACKQQLFESVGGFDALPGYENMDLTFKVFERLGAETIGHIQDVLMHLPDSIAKQGNHAVVKQTVHHHLQRLNIPAVVGDGFLDDSVRVQYQHAEAALITIIVPTKDKVELVRPCIESLLDKTLYPNYEVIVVDNQSSSPDALEFLDELRNLHSDKIRILDYP